MSRKEIIILGTRGIPAKHGGFETFAENLALYLVQNDWQVTVYCQSDLPDSAVFITEWRNIRLVHLAPVFQGKLVDNAIGTILFDFRAIIHALKNTRSAVWLVLGYNTAFLNILPRIKGIKQIFNMDGIEWRRDKWNWLARVYLYINYKIAGWAGNRLIADHPEIENILRKDFNGQNITMIPYGSHVISDADTALLDNYNLEAGKYLLLIARLEPENNILPIVKAWSKMPRKRKLVIVGNYLADTQYLKQIRAAASKDVVFTGPIYDKNTVQALRFYCTAYLHGHRVGGTNPTLVESLGAGSAIIAHDNAFNRWVAGNAGLYFSDEHLLAEVFSKIENNQYDLETLKKNACNRHQEKFQWIPVLKDYERLIENLS
jgi:glycosyltransferase involved in cell wall biosynthesis